MSCLPIESLAHVSEVADSESAFVPLVELAEAIDVDPSTIRRWIPRRGVSARLVRGDWEVDPATLPAKYRARYAGHRAERGSDVSPAPLSLAAPDAKVNRYRVAPAKGRGRAMYRHEAVDCWKKARANRRPGETLAEVEARAIRNFNRRHPKRKPISVRAVKVWAALLDAASGDISALVDGNDGTKQRGRRIPEPARQMFKDEWLRSHEPNLALIYRNVGHVAKQRGWGEMPSYDTFWRFGTKDLPKLVRALLRGSADRPRNVLPYVERDPNTLAPYHTIQSDIRQIDVPVRCDKGCAVCADIEGDAEPAGVARRKGKKKRGHFPYWIVYIDIRSRRILGTELCIDTPTSTQILAVFRRITSENGLTWRVYLDNGSNYRKAFGKQLRREGRQEWDGPSESEARARFATFGVEVTYALPYNAQGKGSVESVLRTFRYRFDEDFEAYRGSLANKSDFARELYERPGELPTLSEMAYLLQLAINEYNSTPHGGKGMDGRTPDQVFYDPSLRLPRRDPDESFAYLFFDLVSGGRVVGRNGIQEKGRTYRLESLEKHLVYYGERVDVRINPDDVREAMIYDRRTGAFVCRARLTEKATHSTRDEITARLIARVMSDCKELMRQARAHVSGAAERLIEYKRDKIARLMELKRQNDAKREAAQRALNDGKTVTVIGPLSSVARAGAAAAGFDEWPVEALLELEKAAATAQELCVAAPRRDKAPRGRRAHPALTLSAIAKKLGCGSTSLDLYRAGKLPWPPGMKEQFDELWQLRLTTPFDAVVDLSSKVMPQRQGRTYVRGGLSYAAIARELGMSEYWLHECRKKNRWRDDATRQRFETLERQRLAERAERARR